MWDLSIWIAGNESITIKGDEVVCVVQLKKGEEVESAETGKEEVEEISETVRDNVMEEEGSPGVETQELSRVGAEEVSEKNSGAEDGSGDNKVAEENKNKVNGDQREEPMETEVEPVKETAHAPEERTGLTPDKIDLAACKTPAKKDDQTASQ